MAKVSFTAARVAGLNCPEDKAQVFLWDTGAPGLGLRVTPRGKPSYVFQGEYDGKSVRIAIGGTDAWTIPAARTRARELQRCIDEGRDPREVKAEKKAADVAARASAVREAVTVGDAWTAYLADRKDHWGDRHYADHEALAKAGGAKAKRGTRGKGVTVDGPIYPLLSKRLVDMKPEVVEAWAARESKTRKTYGRLALRCLKAFLNWCTEHSDYKLVVTANPAKTKKSRQAFGKPAVKTDSLLREQLKAWFGAVRSINNQTTSAYLQTILLTGARPGEVLEILVADADTRWNKLTIRDKVEGEREIPLTPYVAALFASLERPKGSKWMFASVKTEKDKHIVYPRGRHDEACKAAGIDHLTLHGLRRSFKSLTEWLEIPAGVVAQIMGHKPSATAEKHYTVRPLDLLRIHHERIEAWMLEQGGVPFERDDKAKGDAKSEDAPAAQLGAEAAAEAA